MKTTIKLSIIILIAFVFIFRAYTLHPHLEISDLYEVSGTCTNVRKEKGGSGRFSYLRIYITMDNGEDYRISKKLWKYIGGDENNLVGEHISFSVSDKPLSWYGSHGIVAWNDNEESREITFKMENKDNRFSRIICLITVLLVSSIVMLPETVSFLQKRYEKKLKQISEENRASRRTKRQSKRE